MAGLVLGAYLRISRYCRACSTGIAAEKRPGSNQPGPDVSAACFEVPSALDYGRAESWAARAPRKSSGTAPPLVGTSRVW